MQPVFELTADDQPVTSILKDRLISMNISDNEDGEQDSLVITLADRPTLQSDGSQQYIELPKPGVTLACTLGYKEGPGLHNTRPNMSRAGRWTVTAVEVSGGKGGDFITITATGCDLSGDIKTVKQRSWDDIKLGDILKTIAKEHNLKLKADPDLSAKPIDHIDQTESDMHFVTRLAGDYSAYGKFRGDTLVFIKKNSGKTDGGASFPTVTLTKNKLSSWNLSVPASKKYRSVKVAWYDVTTSTFHNVTLGEGLPVLVLPNAEMSESVAKQKAETKLESLKANKKILTISGPVPPDNLLLPETMINLPDMRTGIDGQWRVLKQKLTLDSSGGFHFSAMCVEP